MELRRSVPSPLWRLVNVLLVSSVLVISLSSAQNSGAGTVVGMQTCAHKELGVPGVCRLLTTCQYAIEERKQHKYPQMCGFPDGHSLIPNVCCPTPSGTSGTSGSTEGAGTDPAGTDTGGDTSGGDTLSGGDAEVGTGPKGGKPMEGQQMTCAEYLSSQTTPSTPAPADTPGVKARSMCAKYERMLCTGEINADDQAISSLMGANFVPANRMEYPHMALLGYGERDNVQWSCGGSLISTDFVLTAAHCRAAGEQPVRWVLLGAQNRSETQTRQLIEVREVIVHPQYVPTAKYHDIALLRLAQPAVLTEGDAAGADSVAEVRPACLHTDLDGDVPPGAQATATGWGATGFGEDLSEGLLKGVLTVRASRSCEVGGNTLRESQLCAGGDKAGDGDGFRDTCGGDSGGPLQVFATDDDPACVFRVIGVVSYGPPCGLSSTPAVYTRVSSYVPWMESIVWEPPPAAATGQDQCVPNTGPGSVARRMCGRYLRRWCKKNAATMVPGMRLSEQCHYNLDRFQGRDREETRFGGPSRKPSSAPSRKPSSAPSRKPSSRSAEGPPPLPSIRWARAAKTRPAAKDPQKSVTVSRRQQPPGAGTSPAPVASRMQEAATAEFPHMVILGYGDIENPEYACAGTLISPRFVLTAAHCAHLDCLRVSWVETAVLERADFSKWSGAGERIDVAEVILHPEYHPDFRYNDVALLRLARDAKMSKYVRPACLQTDGDGDVSWTTAFGTGYPANNHWSSVSGKMAKVRLPIQSLLSCRSRLSMDEDSRLPSGIQASQFCTGGNRTKEPFPGDTGGPLQVVSRVIDSYQSYRIVGVSSVLSSCDSERPDVYTKVAHFVQWIENIVWPDEKGNR